MLSCTRGLFGLSNAYPIQGGLTNYPHHYTTHPEGVNMNVWPEQTILSSDPHLVVKTSAKL